jgi:hypothetical protein
MAMGGVTGPQFGRAPHPGPGVDCSFVGGDGLRRYAKVLMEMLLRE